MLNVVDGCIPSDMATGTAAEIEEERRLLYVAMTRARDELHLMVPQRFYVHQQARIGDRHVYATLSRFIPEPLKKCFECRVPAGAAYGATTRRRRLRRPRPGPPRPDPIALELRPARPGSGRVEPDCGATALTQRLSSSSLAFSLASP